MKFNSIFLLLLLYSSCCQPKIINNLYDVLEKIDKQRELSVNFFSHLDSPIILKFSDIEKHSGKTVYVIGLYKQIHVGMRRPGQTQSLLPFQGHVGVYLKEGFTVYIYPPSYKEAIREQEEIINLEGELVMVKGEIYPFIPTSGNNPNSPCLLNISELKKVELK